LQRVCHDGFARREARAHCVDYMVGQDSPLARKAIEPRELAGAGSRVRSLQRFRSDTTWEEEQRRWNYHPFVADALGEPDGVLRCDASGLVKKGQAAAGGARPYGGTLGPGEHGQGGCCAGCAARQG
jgi:SRSO17 transposase